MKKYTLSLAVVLTLLILPSLARACPPGAFQMSGGQLVFVPAVAPVPAVASFSSFSSFNSVGAVAPVPAFGFGFNEFAATPFVSPAFGFGGVNVGIGGFGFGGGRFRQRTVINGGGRGFGFGGGGGSFRQRTVIR